MQRLRPTSLRAKLIATLVPLVVVVVAAMTWLAVSRMTSAQEDAAYAQLREIASANANAIDTDLGAKIARADALANTLAAYRGDDAQEVNAILRHLAERDADSLGYYAGYEPNAFDGDDAAHAGRPYQVEDGGFGPYWNRLSGQLTVEPLIDPYTSDYYTVPKEAGKPVVIEPYLYEGELLTSYVAPILRDGKFVGIAGNDDALTTLNRDVRGIRVLDSGYAMLLSAEGMFVAAPRDGLIGRRTLGDLARDRGNEDLARVVRDVKAGRSGQLETTDPWTGEDVVMSYAPVTTGGWSVVTVAPRSEVLAAATTLRWQLIVTGIVGVLVIAAVIVLLAGRITKPLRAFVQRLRALNDTAVAGLRRGIGALAGGDLTVEATSDVEPLVVKGRDEIADASRTANALIEQTAASVDAYNEARSGLGALIGQVSTSAGAVASSSQQMASTSEEAGRAVGEIAGAVSEVATGAERQARMIASAREAAEQTSEVAEQALELAREGAASSAQATEAMTQVRDSSAHVSDAIRSLAEKSDEIGGIVDSITAIAEQTNLLALNAAIEAARAGDQGRGFAVVADEVRKLAEESQQAAGSIAALIAQIQTETSSAVDVVRVGAERSSEGSEVVERAREAFERIAEAVGDVSTRVGEIASAAGEVAAVAEESSAATEQVSASTQQTNASTQQIAASAQELARTAEELEAQVRRFTLT
ncbi:MAG TPA: methyl-accepting chemotaxis protein [Capillimicrobium sp.]|nr:methyl-accepting chemotaxis protein [Capillimicrobium sp.]